MRILPSIRREKQRFLQVFGSLILIMMAMTGCHGSPQWISAEQAKAEYEDEARSLVLAPGWSWPEAPQYDSKAPDGNKIVYGVNTGRVDAAWYWHCSWGRTYFEAESPRNQEAAFEQVLRLKESAFYRYGLTEEDQQARDKVLALAESGHPEQLRAIIYLNCPLGNESTPTN